MDSMREFSENCRVVFDEQAHGLIECFNEISADYRAIAEQLERERRIKYREHAQIVQQKQQTTFEGESSTAEAVSDKVCAHQSIL